MSLPRRAFSQRWPVLAGVLLIALSFAVYQPGLRGGFIWDDDMYLTGNPLIQAPDGLARFWFTSEALDYYPLSSSVLWLEWRVWGPRVVGYRLVNLILHGLSGVLLWRLLRRRLPELAWPAAALFVLHPANVEAVAWIAQLKTVLATLCALGALHLWLRAEEEPGNRWAYAGALLLFLASLLSKTVAVALPLVLLLLVWGLRGRIRLRDGLRVAPFFAVAMVLGVATAWFQHHHAIAHVDVRPESLLSKVAGTGWAAWFYVGKFVWPHPLVICHPRWTIDPASAAAWLPLLAGLVALGLLAAGARRWGRWPLALILIYLALLAPVLGLLDIGFMMYALVADHWQYMAMPALCALAALALTSLARRRPRLLLVAAAPVAALLVLLGRQQATVFSDEFRVWEHNIRQYPDVWMGHLGLANSLFSAGKPDEALPEYLRVLELKPDQGSAHGNLGALYAMRKDAAAAEPHLREAVRLDPPNPNFHFNLGQVCETKGQWGEAIAHYQSALVYRSNDLAVLYHLATSLLQAPAGPDRDPARARVLAERACRLSASNDFSCLDVLARAHAACGDPVPAGRVATQAAALAAAHRMTNEQARFEALARELNPGR